jgi:O-antigen/teichoic acid export membrane protein
MAYAGAAYWSLVWGTLLGICVRAAAQWLFLTDRPWPNLRFKALAPLWASGSQMVGQRVTWFVTGDFDTFLLGRLGGPIALGSYSLAKTLSHSILDQLSGIVSQVAMPTFAAKAGDVEAQISGLALVVSATSTLVFPLFWMMGIISQVAFPVVFGARWTSLIFPFMAFTCMLPVRSVYALLDSAILGAGRVSTALKNMLTWSVIMIPLMFVSANLSMHIGGQILANSVALTWVIGFPLVFWFAMKRIAAVFKTDVRFLLRPMLRPALCAALSCALIEVADLEARRSGLNAVVQLAIETVVGGGCYWISMRQFARTQYDLVFGLIRRLLRR